MPQLSETIFHLKNDILGYTLKPADFVYKASQQRSLSEESKPFARAHPYASFLIFFIATIAPDFFLSVALATPLVRMAFSLYSFLLILFVWGLVFFSPSDIVYSIVSHKLFKILIEILVEINRKRTFVKIYGMTMKKSFMGSQFSAIIVSSFYCLTFKIFHQSLDQFMRGGKIVKSEAKTPGQSTFTVFAYALATFLIEYSSDLKIYPFIALSMTNMHIVYDTIMIASIFYGILKNITSEDSIFKSLSLSSLFSKGSKPVSRKIDKQQEPVEDEEEEEVAAVETPKKGRTTAASRKRRTSKPT